MKIWTVVNVDGSERDPESHVQVALFTDLEAAKDAFIECIEWALDDQPDFVLEVGATIPDVDWFEVQGEGDEFTAILVSEDGLTQLYLNEVD